MGPHTGSLPHGRQPTVEVGEDRVAGHAQPTTSVPTIPFWAWPGTGQRYW
jgi:hypothetical protein